MTTQRRLDRIREVVARRQRGLSVVLENIHDPHNAAAVFRSCDAFGAQVVHLIFDAEPAFNPRRIGASSSSSANKWLDFSTHTSTAACLSHLKAEGVELVAAVADPAATALPDCDLSADRLALMFGNERDGLSEAALDLADRTLTIPTRGMVRSLNLSVAAAICLYEVTRQRRRQPARFALDAAQRAELERAFQARL